MTIFISNLALAGFRSFGEKIQYFERFSKINLFIGRNNTGKSNVLRFLKEWYNQNERTEALSKDPALRHRSANQSNQSIAIIMGLRLDDEESKFDQDYVENHLLLKGDNAIFRNDHAMKVLQDILAERRRLDGEKSPWIFLDSEGKLAEQDVWIQSIKVIPHDALALLARSLNRNVGSGDALATILRTFVPRPPQISPAQIDIIPAIRKIGERGIASDEFDGTGIIEKLVSLQHPEPFQEEDKKRFEEINNFLRIVTDDQTAHIEVPNTRSTLIVNMGGKRLPIECLGTGIHEVELIP